MNEYDIIVEVEGGKVITAHTQESSLNMLVIDHDEVKLNRDKLLFEVDASRVVMTPNLFSTEITNFTELKQQLKTKYYDQFDNKVTTSNSYSRNSSKRKNTKYKGEEFDF